MTSQAYKYLAFFVDPETANIADMHRKFGFTLNLYPTTLRSQLLRDRYSFMKEELAEFYTAMEKYDYEGMVDALIDLVYVAKGTAVMMGFQWGLHFQEVHGANMKKERGHNPARPEQEEDLIKPEGWKPPNHTAILTHTITQTQEN